MTSGPIVLQFVGAQMLAARGCLACAHSWPPHALNGALERLIEAPNRLGTPTASSSEGWRTLVEYKLSSRFPFWGQMLDFYVV